MHVRERDADIKYDVSVVHKFRSYLRYCGYYRVVLLPDYRQPSHARVYPHGLSVKLLAYNR